MKRVVASFQSLSPYGQGRKYETPKLDREIPEDYEHRTWRDRCHVDESGHVFIPAMAFKNCVRDVAKYLSQQIPGKGKSTYTKHFLQGILVLEGLLLPITKDQVEGTWVFTSSSGKPGGEGPRVYKCFPTIPQWSGEVEFIILDDIITEEVFSRHLTLAGQYIGLGVWRAQKGGLWGRFQVKNIAWHAVM
jgi:hypothetical protein